MNSSIHHGLEKAGLPLILTADNPTRNKGGLSLSRPVDR